jgi:hypothetical protein
MTRHQMCLCPAQPRATDQAEVRLKILFVIQRSGSAFAGADPDPAEACQALHDTEIKILILHRFFRFLFFLLKSIN